MTDSSDPVPADADDRQVMERILGRPLSQTWPTGALAPGSRVTVVRDPDWDGPWQVEFPGTIDAMGAPVPDEHARALSGELLYRVDFDTRQYDSGGDGPYRKARIWGRYLRTEPEPEEQGCGRSGRRARILRRTGWLTWAFAGRGGGLRPITAPAEARTHHDRATASIDRRPHDPRPWY